ncbi:MAG: excinuclease ABC subunit UvrC [Clostridia bacterium]|nr:excinuclease ABC subunit UvrC [Clostridia bacterium]
MNERISTLLAELPESSGVYLMRDKNNNIIYIGKAVNLKNRVRSYFNSSPKGEKVMAMVEKIADFDYILTNSEVDALVLENTLIKQHSPHYNILLKDDKLYPFLRIDTTQKYPTVEIIRRLKADKAKYFGPYMIGITAKDMLDLIYSAFPIRSCKLNMDKVPKNHRPCLNYHIGKCTAPCCKKITPAQYKEIINKVVSFLRGEDKEVRDILQSKMLYHSERLEFELALEYKRRLEVMEKMVRHQVVALPKDFDLDIFGVAVGESYNAVSVLSVRGGKLVNADKFPVDKGEKAEDILSTLIYSYYDNKPIVAREILTTVPLPDKEVLSLALSQKAKVKITISTPKIGTRKELADMADKNAREFLTRSTLEITRRENMTKNAVIQLGKILSIPPPYRIECFDISNISGTDKVSSMTVFKNGEKATKMYRTFRIKTVEGSNDFACMGETLFRRLARLKEGADASFKERPGLIVIDGGIGQVGYAIAELEKAGLSDIPLIGLAEREETIVFPDGRELLLPRNSFALMLLQRIRDEAHRFAINYHRKLRQERTLKSKFLEIEGVGKNIVKLLYDKFKSYEGVKKATYDQLIQVKGIGDKIAKAIIDFFAKDEEN